MKIIRTFSLAACAAMALTACAPKTEKAESPAEAPTGKDAARADAGKTVAELMTPTFTGEQQGRILNMGYFMAASALCPDLEVDAQKMGRAVEAMLALDTGAATPEQKSHQHDAALMFLGMSSGAILGSHIDDKDQFCADAAKLKEGPPEGHLFAAGAPSAPSTAPVPAGEPEKK